MNNLSKKILTFFLDFRLRYILNKKISKIYKRIRKERISLPENILLNNKNLWGRIDNNHNDKWLKVYASINGNIDEEYVSEQAYYNVVEKTLNNPVFSEAYSDKNVYLKFIDKNILPKVFLRKIQGVYYNEDYNQITDPDLLINSILKSYSKIVCKKSIETGGGKDISIFSKINGSWIDGRNNELSISYLNKLFQNNYLIQEYIFQHSFFQQFNPSSVNTIRVFTYRSVSDNEIHILHAILRIGKPGSIVDNQASGGISCGIDLKTGILNDFAINKTGQKFFKINDVAFKDKKIPKFDCIKKYATDIAYKFPYHRLLGFDFSVDKEEKVKLIEINNRNNEINFFQMNNGPLFKGYTNEIIDYCLKNKRTIKLDFEI